MSTETQGNTESRLASTQSLHVSSLSDASFPLADQFVDPYNFPVAHQLVNSYVDPYNFPVAHQLVNSYVDPYNFPLADQLDSFEFPPVAGDLLLGSSLGNDVNFNFVNRI